jgi:hypothetical protein
MAEMLEDALPSNVPAWLQKDLVSTCHEVPVADGQSYTAHDNFYSPRLMRWAVDQWIESVPTPVNLCAFQRALESACADTRTFHAYLQLPEAFEETYQEELGKLNEHRSELASVKRVLDARHRTRPSGWAYLLGGSLIAAIAIVTAAMLQ